MKRQVVMLPVLFALLCQNAFADSAFTLPSGVHIKIAEAKFQKDNFRISGCGDTGKPCLINGHIPFGLIGNLPKTYVTAIAVSYQGHSYSLDTSNMYDAWGSRPLAVKGAIRYFGGSCSSIGICQFRGIFSDGVGSFVAEWQIVDGLSFRTILSDSNDVVNLFIHNIDPPED